MSAKSKELIRQLEIAVGSDGTDDLRIIVDVALEEDPDICLSDLIEVVKDCRSQKVVN